MLVQNARITLLAMALVMAMLTQLWPTEVHADASLKDLHTMVNIDEWHKAGYKGKGVEIVVIDKGELSLSYDNIKKVEDPFGNVFTKKKTDSHLSKVVETIHLNAPDAKIYVFQDISMIHIHDWIVKEEKDIDLMNFSLSRNLTEKEKKVMPLFAEKDVLMVTAIGNNGEEKINPVALNPYWTSVGAVEKTRDGFELAVYSGIHDTVDFVSFTSIPLQDGSFLGTSASAPFLTGTVATYLNGYEKNRHDTPGRPELIDMMKDNVLKPVTMDARKYGNGVFRLPSLRMFEKASDEKLPETITTKKDKLPGTRGTSTQIFQLQKHNIMTVTKEMRTMKLNFLPQGTKE